MAVVLTSQRPKGAITPLTPLTPLTPQKKLLKTGFFAKKNA